MKKRIIITGLAFTLVLAASAQENVKPNKPPEPPKPPVEIMKELPPTPPEPPAPPAPPPPPPPMIQEQMTLPAEYRAFLLKNPSISSLNWNEGSVIITLKSGKVERYLLNKGKTSEEAEAKYGNLPIAPPPPPPPPLPPVKPSKKSES